MILLIQSILVHQYIMQLGITTPGSRLICHPENTGILKVKCRDFQDKKINDFRHNLPFEFLRLKYKINIYLELFFFLKKKKKLFFSGVIETKLGVCLNPNIN